MENININKRIVLSLLVIFIGTIAFLMNINRRENLHITPNHATVALENWIIKYKHSAQNVSKLPINLDLEKGEVYEASTVLPMRESHMEYLLLRSSMQDMIVYLDEKEIHRYEKPKDAQITKPLASTWVMVKLPEDFQGKTLKLILKSEVEAFSGVINEVKLGEASALIYDVFKHSFSGFVVFLLVFSMGLLITFAAIFMKNVEDNRFLYLGLFALSTSLFVLSEARIMQFFTGNRYIIGGMSYLMVPLMGIFISLYAKEAIFIEKKHKKAMQMMVTICFILLVGTVSLQALGIVSFIEFMPFVLVILLINTVIFIRMMYLELLIQKNKEAKQFFKYMSILAISVLFEGITFYSRSFEYTSLFLRMGILIFFSFLVLDSYDYLKMSFEKQKERLLLEKLAYKDFLTGAYNRTAFAKDLEALMGKEESTFRLVLLDLNELKYINDHYGHGDGDEAIKKVYQIMHEVFSPFGVCYRIGGDEFAILIENPGKELFKIRLKHFRHQIKEQDDKLVYPFDVAVGTDVYTSELWPDYTSFYHHVDQRMYKDKMERKQKRTPDK